MILPSGAEAVIESRKRGLKPAEMLVVSLVGKTGESNHTVYANPTADYDWRWLVGLDACLYVRDSLPWKPIALQIARVRPRWLGVFDVDRFKGADAYALPLSEDIEKPIEQWRYQLATFRWTTADNEHFAWGS